MKILIVDDDPAALLVASMALEEIGGFEVITAQSGTEAIDKAVAEQPDSVLVDIIMYDLDGREVLKELCSRDQTRNIPVIFHTAKTGRAEIEELMALGARGVISKPFDPLQLPNEVRRLLQLPARAADVRHSKSR